MSFIKDPKIFTLTPMQLLYGKTIGGMAKNGDLFDSFLFPLCEFLEISIVAVYFNEIRKITINFNLLLNIVTHELVMRTSGSTSSKIISLGLCENLVQLKMF